LINEAKLKRFDNSNSLNNLKPLKQLNYINFTKLINVKRLVYNQNLFDINKIPKRDFPFLILDIDETLVSSFHVTEEVDKSEINGNFHELKFDNNLAKVFLKIRPYALEFVEKMNNYFQLVIYSHGKDFYVDKVARLLDPRSNHFFFKE
jgi:TFIIF-interacting CTD phosphatase-like protein